MDYGWPCDRNLRSCLVQYSCRRLQNMEYNFRLTFIMITPSPIGADLHHMLHRVLQAVHTMLTREIITCQPQQWDSSIVLPSEIIYIFLQVPIFLRHDDLHRQHILELGAAEDTRPTERYGRGMRRLKL